MDLEAKQKFYLILGITIIGLILVSVFVTLPLVRSLQRTAESFIETRRELFRLETAKDELNEIEEQYSKTGNALARINDSLFEPEKDDLDFILLVERMAKETSNVHTLSAPAYSSEEGSSPYFSSTLVLRGTFDNLLRFLGRFDNMKFYTDIDGITIRTMGGGGEEGPILETRLSFKVYTL